MGWLYIYLLIYHKNSTIHVGTTVQPWSFFREFTPETVTKRALLGKGSWPSFPTHFSSVNSPWKTSGVYINIQSSMGEKSRYIGAYGVLYDLEGHPS